MAQPLIDLDGLAAEVGWPDNDAAAAVREQLVNHRELGRLGEFAEWLAGMHGGLRELNRVRLVRFGESRQDAVESIAESVGAAVRTIDTPAAADAVAAGAAAADDEIERGSDLLIAAGADLGQAAAIVVSVLTSTEPVKVLARGAAATDPEAWMDRVSAVRDARRGLFALRERPQQLLTALDRADLAATAGFVLRAAARRTPVLLDGLSATAAALVAYEAQPRATQWCRVADTLADPAQVLATSRLGQRPVLELDLRAGDGTAGLLVVPVLRAAVAAATRYVSEQR